MKRDIALEKVEILLDDYKQVVLAMAAKMFDSGLINTDKYITNGFALPKILVTAAIKSSTDTFAPRNEAYMKDVENLKKV